MWDKVGSKNWRRPLLLRQDNFTPPARTPWGGRRIVEQLKAGFHLPTSGPVGEAWELSVEPDFPSRLVEGPTLDEVLRSDPSALLGREASLESTGLLVKLLDAADDLSVQIHPEDTDPHLAADESGKPEAWYIIDADPGAGLYIGLREEATPQKVRTTVDENGDVDALLTFVPVSAGDVFVIEPGTPHSVGKGVLLLEPQRVLPGKRGITYRYWDWNRRYDESGGPDPARQPRALHLERALEVTRWDNPRGEALLDRVRYRAGPPKIDAPASIQPLISGSGPLHSAVFDVQRLAGTGSVELPPHDSLRSLTVLEGRVTLVGEEVDMPSGQTAALPACLGTLHLELDRAHAVLCTLA